MRPGLMNEIRMEPSVCEAVSLMTGSDDTVLEDVSVRLTPSLTMFPLT